jgi:antirestriction protein ArdC
VAGISNQTVELSASYIESWLTMFRTDKLVLIRAAGKAQKAADYILNRTAETGGDHDLCLQGQEAEPD